MEELEQQERDRRLFAPTSQFNSWLAFAIFAPICAIGVTWFYGASALDIRHFTLHMFATGEPILVATLIVIGVATDVDHEIQFSQRFDSGLTIAKPWLWLYVTALAIGYGLLKANGLALLNQSQLPDLAKQRLDSVARFSIVLLGTSAIIAAWIKQRVLRKQIADLKKALS